MADPISLLRSEVAGFQAYIEEVEDRLDTDIADIEDRLDKERAQLNTRLAALSPAAASAATANPAQPWTATATATQWQELAAWVDWLNETYELPLGSRIPPCWPAHAGASEQLAALWHSWQAARAAQVAAPEDDMIAWHERWLWATLPHIGTMVKDCESETGHRRRPPGPPTDLNAGLG